MDYTNCTLCPRMCGADRTKTVGFCGSGAQPVIARAALHFWEEPCISGKRGSGTVFFSGCTLRCIYCQNRKISRDNFGIPVTQERLHEAMEHLVEAGAHNINLVTPTHYLPSILPALDGIDVPIVMNTGGYERVETIRELEGHIDVYLPDLKYCDRELGQKLSAAPDYFDYASKALIEMARQVGNAQYNEEGILTRGMIVRHLVLPGHLGNTLRALKFIKNELPEGTLVSLMAQYTPCFETPYKELNRPLSHLEYDTVVNQMVKLGLKNGFLQELESADPNFIPPFEKLEIL